MKFPVNLISYDPDMAKPLVTHVLWTLGRGGAERMVLDLARRLPEVGYAVRVVAAGGGGDMERDFTEAGIALSINPGPGSRRRTVSFLRQEISEHRPAIWHTHLTPVWGGLAARSSFVRPWVATIHGYESGLPWPMRLGRSFAYRRADYVVCVSEAVRASLRMAGALRPSRSTVIPPGIDPERFKAREARLSGDTPELLTVSRLVHEKGLDVLLEALSGVLRPWRLTIVGDGPEFEALKRQAEVLGILPRVRFAGGTSDPSPFYQRADLFCLPSRSEGQGIALLEAAAARVPAIASDLPAVREAFGEDAVAYAAPGSVEAWRRGLERALARYPEALARADRAQAAVSSRYTLDVMAQSHAELYRRLLGRRAV